jgi:hypothetical protein
MLVAAKDGAHARCADRARLSHELSAFADQDHGLFGADDSGCGCGGDLADRVPGATGNQAEAVGWVLEQGQQRDETCAHDQGLRDCGVPDRLGIGLGAVLDQVDAGDSGKPLHAVAEARQLEPGREEAGGLGALSRADDDEHLFSLACEP